MGENLYVLGKQNRKKEKENENEKEKPPYKGEMVRKVILDRLILPVRDWIVSPQKLYVEALIPSVTYLEIEP